MKKPPIVIEFIAARKEQKLDGILAIPRISRNGNLYLPEELAKADGKVLPVLWNHEGSPTDRSETVNPTDIIGTMLLTWDPDLMQLKYQAELDGDLPVGVPLHTSLGAFFDYEDHVCGSHRCYAVPRGLQFVEASITPTPGIPETTVNIRENYDGRCCGMSENVNNSHTNGLRSAMHMSANTPTETSVVTEEKSPQVSISSHEQIAQIITEMTKNIAGQMKIGIDATISNANEQFKNIHQMQLEKLSEIIGLIKPKVAENKVPSSMTSDLPAGAKAAESARIVEFFQRVKDRPKDSSFPAISWELDKDEYLARWGYKVSSGASKTKTEAVTVTAGDMGQVFSKSVLVLPGGRLKTPVRQYCNFEEIANGADRVHFYTIGAFDFGAITEGTEPTNVSQTVAKVTATPSVRGGVQRVGYSQVENAPFGLVNAINEAMMMASIDDEAMDLLTTVYDAVSPTNWVRADTGAAIASDDIANLTFKREGLLAAKRLIAQRGYDVSPGNLVLFVHPKGFQELMLDTNLNNYYQYARPDITSIGVLEQLYGVDIVIADQVKAQDNTTNDTYRNVMAVKNVAFGMGAARNLSMEAQRRNEVQQIIISGTHRVKSVVISEDATCRISSAQ
ncbi:MAG: hypothetical protein ACREA4_03555 [Nitrososphaera sp.]